MSWTATEWAAFGAIATAAITFFLVAVGAYQISAIRDQNRRWRTLAACERYYLDPLLDKASRALKEARESGELERNPKPLSIDVITVLNYLDGIAIGIYQGLYIEELARDHLQPMVEENVAEFLRGDTPGKLGLNLRDFRHLVALEGRWTQIGQPHFREVTLLERSFKAIERRLNRRRGL
jgi:hypothetical protein